MIMGGLSIWHILLVIVVIMILFGRGRISHTMEELGHGIKAFKKGLKDDDVPTPPTDKTAPPRE